MGKRFIASPPFIDTHVVYACYAYLHMYISSCTCVIYAVKLIAGITMDRLMTASKSDINLQPVQAKQPSHSCLVSWELLSSMQPVACR